MIGNVGVGLLLVIERVNRKLVDATLPKCISPSAPNSMRPINRRSSIGRQCTVYLLAKHRINIGAKRVLPLAQPAAGSLHLHAKNTGDYHVCASQTLEAEQALKLFL